MDNTYNRNKAAVIFSLVIMLSIIVVVLPNQIAFQKSEKGIISTDKETYSVGESVDLTLSRNSDKVHVELLTPKGIYKYLNPTLKLKYQLTEAGEYTVNFYEDGELKDSLTFSVINPEESQNKDIFRVSKDKIILGEEISIVFNETLLQESYTISISTESKDFNFMSKITGTLKFLPKEEGKYQISLNENSKIVQTEEFIVVGSLDMQANETEKTIHMEVPEENSTEINKSLLPNVSNEDIRDDSPENITGDIKNSPQIKMWLKNSQGYSYLVDAKVVPVSPPKNAKITLAANSIILGKSDIDLYPEIAGIEKLEIRGADLQNFELGLESLESGKINLPERIKKGFAIDPSNMDFSSGRLTVQASGNKLFKCKDWNFTQQVCKGDWSYLQDITPGKTYSILIDQNDPAFAEVGLASINTNKSIYHPNETVKLIMVVLDTSGHLVNNADVKLTITDPESSSYEISEITQTSKGIYEAIFSQTKTEGNYSILVEAFAPNVNNSMRSYFIVKSSYGFDIIRNTPVTIDPSLGPFESIIKISSFNYPGIFSFTEKLPSSFSIADAPSAEITQDESFIYLKWQNLTNESNIVYRAQTPLKTPELYELGESFIEYGANVFTEAKPWFLAVDPAGGVNVSQPDAGAPGMNVVVQFIGNSFTSSDTVTVSSSDIKVGPILVTDANGNQVTSNGRVLTTAFFISPNAAEQNVTVSISGTPIPKPFQIINPKAQSGNFTGRAGNLTIGDGFNGTRTFGGTIVLDSLIIPSGAFVYFSTSDPDVNATNGNQAFMPAIILVNGPVSIVGVLNISGKSGGNNPSSRGGDGGPGGGGGGGGGKTGTTVIGADGGRGYSGGGGGGVEATVAGGDGGNGSGSSGTANSGTSGGNGGMILSGNATTYGEGGADAGTGGDAGAGGTGFPFGSGGTTGTYVSSLSSPAGVGGGGGAGSNSESNGGGGGGFGTAGSNAGTTVAGNEAGSGGLANGNPHLVPFSGGSGGGGASADEGGDDREGGGGGGGGGAVVIYSISNITVSGTIGANGGGGGTGEGGAGGVSGGGGGSGGAIILQSSNVSVGASSLAATGGAGGPTSGSGTAGGAGGEGRVRVDGLMGATNIPGTLTSEFVGPSIRYVNSTRVIGRANASTDIDIIIQNSGGTIARFTGSSNSSGDFIINVTMFGGMNYITVLQNTSSDQVRVLSSASLYQFQGSANPEINSIECEVNSAGNWQACNNVLYGTTLLRVRANCTIAGGTLSNVTFALYNVQDSTTLFNSTTTDNSTGFWILDISDETITQSGDYNLSAICLSNTSLSQTNTTEWFVPWGTLSSTMVTPTQNIQVIQNTTFNYTTRLLCSGGECDDVNATAMHSASPFGTGRDGSITVSTVNRVINNYTYLTNNVTVSSQALIVNSADGFLRYDEILIIQMQNGSYGQAGTYEFVDISSINGTTIYLLTPLKHSYYTGDFNNTNNLSTSVQIIRVPHYVNVTVNSGSSMVAQAWDGWTGGIIVFRAAGNLNISGSINATARGFRGGTGGITSGGRNGESFDGLVGRGGIYCTTTNCAGGVGLTGGGAGGNNNGGLNTIGNRGGGGGGGYDGQGTTEGGGGGAGGGYGGGGGGGGGSGDGGTASGAGGVGGATGISAGGGGGAASGAGGVGGNAGSAGTGGSNGVGGAAGSGSTTGTGGGAHSADADSGGAGGGGGGLYGSTDLSTIFLGSGGGGSGDTDEGATNGQNGGTGGGIIFIYANKTGFQSTGTIASNGGNGTAGGVDANPYGASGGGSGGSIYLVSSRMDVGTSLISASGGGGGAIGSGAGTTGAGGGSGGVGRIRLDYINITGTAYSEYNGTVPDVGEPFTILSNISGTTPFWTSSTNPRTPAQQVCLRNMISGSSCNTTWVVNATGKIDTTWAFLVSYFPYTYFPYVLATESPRINVTIVNEISPEILLLECQENGVTWGNCTNVQFNDVLSAVRGQCTYSLGDPISYMNFSLKNMNDNRIYFSGNTSDNSTGYWVLDIADFTIRDSGTFNLSSTCTVNPTGEEDFNWSVPFGNLTVTLLPLTNQSRNVSQNKFFTYRANVTCVGGECGDGNVSVGYADPNAILVFLNSTFEASDEGWIYQDDIYQGTSQPAEETGTRVTDANCASGSCLQVQLNTLDDATGPWSGGWNKSFNVTLSPAFINVTYNFTLRLDGTTEAAESTSMFYRNITNGAAVQGLTISHDNPPGGDNITRGVVSYLATASNGVIYFDTGCWLSDVSAAGENADCWIDNVVISGIGAQPQFSLISTTQGIQPFYTTTTNPTYPISLTCLTNMSAGDSCAIEWQVNSTGSIGTTWSTRVSTTSLNYSLDVGFRNSSIINLTIVNNTLPSISSISLTPTTPEDNSDLTCTFTAIDTDVFDNVTVNLTWYRNNISYESLIFNITSGQQYSDIMELANTTIGDFWFCVATPFDPLIGTNGTSNTVEILADAPPIINSIECEENNTTWGACSNIAFNDYLTRVRTNCTDSNRVTNATFSLVNVPDNTIFFNSTSSYMIGNYTILNISDILIRDSGEFNLHVVCRDNASNERYDLANWTVPWGVLNATLVSPSTNVNVSKGMFFTYQATVNCTGGECGYANASVWYADPVAAAIYLNSTFEASDEGWVYQDDLYQSTVNPASANGQREANANCASGFCLAVELNINSPTTTGAMSGGWNKSFNVTLSPVFINITYNFTLRLDTETEATESTSFYYRNLTSRADVLALTIVHDNPGVDTITRGVVSQLAGVSNGIYYFDTGCWLSDVSTTTENAECWIDNVLIRGIGTELQYSLISTTQGATPFYTTTSNPLYPFDLSCLSNMSAGDSCTASWEINATGTAGTTWSTRVTSVAMNYSQFIASPNSTIVNLTIVNNTLPQVTTISLLPIFVADFVDLNCSFTVFDPDFDNDLSVNVTWFRNNITFESNYYNVTNNQLTTDIMENTNTSISEEWHCQVRPFDNLDSGTPVNSTHRVILDNAPPALSDVQCQIQNTTWTTCTGITYGQNFTAVRANCTDDLKVQNVTFKFYNVEDNKTYFTNITTYNISQLHVFNISDIHILDSGEFYLNVTCYDNTSFTDMQVINWSIPFGTLTANLVSPAVDTAVQRFGFFDFISSVTCSGGECGSVNASFLYVDDSTEEVYLNSTFESSEEGYLYQDDIYLSTSSPAQESGQRESNASCASGFCLAVNLNIESPTGPGGPYSGGWNKSFNVTRSPAYVNVTFDYTLRLDFEVETAGEDVVLYYRNLTDGSIIEGDRIVGDTAGGSDFFSSGTIEQVAILSNGIYYFDAGCWLGGVSATNENAECWIDNVLIQGNGVEPENILISTTQGDTPFYTINPNPTTPNNLSCLANLTGGQTCQVTWSTNATGSLFSVWDVFVNYNPIRYTSQVIEDATSIIKLNITDAALVPPIITLFSPSSGAITNNPAVNFTCGATDNVGLRNISLYADFTGSFIQNQTVDASGTSANVTFNKTLQEGFFTWTCRAYDTDNNNAYGINRTLTVDLTAPRINLTQPANGSAFTVDSVTFGWNATDNFASSMTCNLTVWAIDNSYNYSTNLVASANNTEITRTINNIQAGITYSWNVTCLDTAGNVNTSLNYFFAITDLPPNVQLQTQDNYWVSDDNITLYYNASDNAGIDHADLYVKGILNQTDSSIAMFVFQNFEILNISEGIYNWSVNVTDSGNLTAGTSIRTFYIDYSPAAIVLNNPPNGSFFNTSSITINFTAIDNLDSTLSCNITVNNTIEASGLSADNNTEETQLITGLSDGIHFWNITCIDEAGNINTSVTRTLNISGHPTVTLNYPPNNFSTSSTGIDLNYTPSDNTGFGTCDLFINGIFNQSEPSPINDQNNNFQLEDAGQGIYVWSVNCTDQSGFQGFSESRTFTIDTRQPNVTLQAPSNGETIIATIVYFNFTAIDNLDSTLDCNLTLDGALNLTGISAQNNTLVSRNITILTEATHFWNVTCVDNAGNINTSETRNFTMRVPPIVTLNSPEDNYLTNINEINFSYYTLDSSGIKNASLIINGQINQTNTTVINDETNTFNLSNLADGTYTWAVMVFDIDNLSTNSTTRTFTIDATKPIVAILTPANNSVVTNNNFSIEFTSIDNFDSTLLCNLTFNGLLHSSNINLVNDTINTTLELRKDGTYNLSVLCIDNANNTNTSGISYFSIEAPPNVTLNAPANNTRTRNTSLLFYFTPYDPFSIHNCTIVLDGTLNETNTSPANGQINSINVNNISEGFHNWTAQCIDEAPDLNPYSPIPWYFRIDLSGPAIVLRQPTPDQTFNLNNITFNYTAIETDSVNVVCNITVTDPFGTRINSTQALSGEDHIITITNFSDGDHFWNVTCVDDLGNVNTSETRRFIVNQPDLFTNNSYVGINNTNPDLLENITLFANVSNLGGLPASNVLVTFYDGNPGAGGTFIGNDTDTIGVNGSVIFTTSWLITPGFHTIYISVDPNNLVAELNETNNNATINISVLWANITAPQNNTWRNILTVPFNFTARDYTGNLINYSVRVDGSATGINGTLTDGNNVTRNITFTEGSHVVVIRVNDTLGRFKDSPGIRINIDVTSPSTTFNTQNQTWFNITNPQINFTISDNLDTMLNYTVIVNGIPDITGNLSTGSSALVNLSNLPNGTHQVIIEAFDEAGNIANSSILTIYVDTVEPTISLLYPGNGANIFTPSTDLNFTVIDNLDTLLQCNVTYDSSIVNSVFVANNSINRTVISALTEGTHFWNVTCWDGNTVTPISLRNTSQTSSFNIFNPPNITLLEPLDNNWTNLENVTFFFNATDETGLQNCSVLLNGIVQQTKLGSELLNGGRSNITVNELNGTYLWAVQCFDNTSQNNYAITGNRTLNVDIDSPLPFILTQNNTWFNTATPLISINITDNMDSNINFTIYANSSINRIGNVSNATSANATLSALTDGAYLITLEGLDEAYNRRNSTPITLYVDTTPPAITLIRPENGNSTIETNIFFNFTALDNMANSLLCNLTVDNVIQQGFNLTSGQYNSTTLSMSAGTHYWNVTCIDIAGNTNTSETRNFTIPLPDLSIISADIKFNNSFPEEGKNITINATIYNFGETNAQDVIAQFYQGNYNLSNQINGNYTFNLSAGANITINVSWQVAGAGRFDIYVVVDPPIATGGSILEANESNNFAFNTIEIGSYHVIYGNFTGLKNIEDLTNRTIFEWNITEFNASKIYAADYDSSVSWANLHAISRNISGNFVFNDFNNIDVALQMENNTDSINATWTLNNNVKLAKGYRVFLNTITNAPAVNSTNVSNFMTGILWDTTDGNTEYNSSQDLVFVTEVNIAKQGQLGIYDYELKIPSNLKLYKGPNLATVSLYTEIE